MSNDWSSGHVGVDVELGIERGCSAPGLWTRGGFEVDRDNTRLFMMVQDAVRTHLTADVLVEKIVLGYQS